MYRYIFGPVPSRRLGMSLGVDLVPKKVCSLNCTYCEVGETTLSTTERKEYIKFELIKKELVDFFSNDNPDPDYITFSGSGEPTLNSSLKEIVKLIKFHRPAVPTALLTNGTLFSDPAVRDAVMDIDLVLPSLDAVTGEVFEKINRPDKSVKVEEYIQGLIDFSKQYKGKIYLEVFIIPGCNDSRSHLLQLREKVIEINPDKIQLNTLDRPGAVSDIRAATEEELKRVIEILDMDNIEIAAKVGDRKSTVAYRKDAETAILQTVLRRPCTLDDLSEILGLHVNEINKYLSELEKDNRIEVVKQDRGYFYKGL